MSQPNRPKVVYSIVREKDRDDYWQRLGIAFVNRDGSLNVKLQGLPINGELHIRDAKEKEGQ